MCIVSIYYIYIYALVIAQFRVQYDQYFPNFSYCAYLFHDQDRIFNESFPKRFYLLCPIAFLTL